VGRVINIENPGKERTSLIRNLNLAVYEFSKENQSPIQKSDLTAFMALTLSAISRTVERSVQAWEKRGYWLKADRFRLEWMWTESLGKALREALIGEQWNTVDQTVKKISERLIGVELPKRAPKIFPWVGAYDKFLSLYRPE
jgi:hypothetical protein